MMQPGRAGRGRGQGNQRTWQQSSLGVGALSSAARLAAGLCMAASLGFGCVSGGAPTDPPDEIKKYIVDKLPEGTAMTALNVNFDDKITLLGMSMDPPATEVTPGKRIKLTLYWRVDKALDDTDWRLFTHVLDGAGERLMNIDNVGPLRHIEHNRQAWAPGSWKPGKIYVDSQSFQVPRKVKSSKVQVVTGIWRSHDRLPIKSGPSISDNRALLATLTVTGKGKGESEPVPQIEVSQIKKGNRVKIDGKLSEDAWTSAVSTPAFVNVSNGKAAPDSPVQGTAKLLWDDKALYVGFEVKEQNVVGGFDKAQKDPHLWTKDCVEIMLDPDGDGDNKDYYEIQINPQNLVFDTQYDEYNKPQKQPDGPFGHEDWSSKLESAVRVKGTIDDSSDKDEGYVVEAKIPWSSFDKAKKAPPEPGSSWRVNLYAMKNNDGVAWSPILGEGNFHKAARFGRINWVITPSPVSEKSVARDDKSEKAEGEAAPAGKGAPASKGTTASAEPGSAHSAAADGDSKDKELTVSRKALQQAPAKPAPAEPH